MRSRSVRRFASWLEGFRLSRAGCWSPPTPNPLLGHANQKPPSTWQSSTGTWALANDGLQLLEDLYGLQTPTLVAILITGFAHQATPLDAMRMGVARLPGEEPGPESRRLPGPRSAGNSNASAPAKRERRLHQSLVGFREAVDKVAAAGAGGRRPGTTPVQTARGDPQPVPVPAADDRWRRTGVLLAPQLRAGAPGLPRSFAPTAPDGAALTETLVAVRPVSLAGHGGEPARGRA